MQRDSVNRAIFLRLQPVCTSILDQSGDRKSQYHSITALQALLKESTAEELYPFFDYVNFPLSLLLDNAIKSNLKPVTGPGGRNGSVGSGSGGRPSAAAEDGVVGDRAAEALLRCYEALLAKRPCETAEELASMLSRFSGLLALPRACFAEEVRTSCLRCVMVALKGMGRASASISQTNGPGQNGLVAGHGAGAAEGEGTFSSSRTVLGLSPLQWLRSEAAAPLLGHLLSLCIQLAEAEVKEGATGSRQLRTLALKTLRQLIAQVKTQESLAFFLPGVVSGLSRAIAQSAPPSNRITALRGAVAASATALPGSGVPGEGGTTVPQQGAAAGGAGASEAVLALQDMLVCVLGDASCQHVAAQGAALGDGKWVAGGGAASRTMSSPLTATDAMRQLQALATGSVAGKSLTGSSETADARDAAAAAGDNAGIGTPAARSHLMVQPSAPEAQGGVPKKAGTGTGPGAGVSSRLRVQVDSAWVSETAERLQRLLVMALPPLCLHPRPSVRAALGRAAVTLLRDCRHTLGSLTDVLLDCVLVLAYDDWPQVAGPCRAALITARLVERDDAPTPCCQPPLHAPPGVPMDRARGEMGGAGLPSSWEDAPEASIRPPRALVVEKATVAGTLTRLINGLARAVRSPTEDVAVAHLRRLTAAMCLAGPQFFCREVLLPPASRAKFVSALLQSLATSPESQDFVLASHAAYTSSFSGADAAGVAAGSRHITASKPPGMADSASGPLGDNIRSITGANRTSTEKPSSVRAPGGMPLTANGLAANSSQGGALISVAAPEAPAGHAPSGELSVGYCLPRMPPSLLHVRSRRVYDALAAVCRLAGRLALLAQVAAEESPTTGKHAPYFGPGASPATNNQGAGPGHACPRDKFQPENCYDPASMALAGLVEYVLGVLRRARQAATGASDEAGMDDDMHVSSQPTAHSQTGNGIVNSASTPGLGDDPEEAFLSRQSDARGDKNSPPAATSPSVPVTCPGPPGRSGPAVPVAAAAAAAARKQRRQGVRHSARAAAALLSEVLFGASPGWDPGSSVWAGEAGARAGGKPGEGQDGPGGPDEGGVASRKSKGTVSASVGSSSSMETAASSSNKGRNIAAGGKHAGGTGDGRAVDDEGGETRGGSRDEGDVAAVSLFSVPEGVARAALLPHVTNAMREYLASELWDLPVDLGQLAEIKGGSSKGASSKGASAVAREKEMAGFGSLVARGGADELDVTVRDLNDNALLLQTLLEGLGCLAKSLGKGCADGRVMSMILYPMLDKLGSGSALVSEAAAVALRAVCQQAGYPTVGALVVANADYVVDSLCRQMRHLELYPTAPQILVAVLHRTGTAAELLPLLNEPLRAVLSGLSIASRRQFPQHTFSFVMALREVVTAASSESERLAARARAAAQFGTARFAAFKKRQPPPQGAEEGDREGEQEEGEQAEEGGQGEGGDKKGDGRKDVADVRAAFLSHLEKKRQAAEKAARLEEGEEDEGEGGDGGGRQVATVPLSREQQGELLTDVRAVQRDLQVGLRSSLADLAGAVVEAVVPLLSSATPPLRLAALDALQAGVVCLAHCDDAVASARQLAESGMEGAARSVGITLELGTDYGTGGFKAPGEGRHANLAYPTGGAWTTPSGAERPEGVAEGDEGDDVGGPHPSTRLRQQGGARGGTAGSRPGKGVPYNFVLPIVHRLWPQLVLGLQHPRRPVSAGGNFAG
eukprot:jgi/Mesvir1/6965/Mv09110-RA.2